MKALRVLVLMLMLALGMLTGCAGKSVSVVQSTHFKTMADRMGDELVARQILDASRNYVAPVMDFTAEDTPFGREIFRRLQPDFLSGDVGASCASFAELVPVGDSVRMRFAGFTIYGRQFIRVNMIALVDWDEDGKKDWMLSCAVEPLPGARKREYYVVVPNPPAAGPLRGTVVGVYESTGVYGKMYMSDPKAPAKPATPAASAPLPQPPLPGGSGGGGSFYNNPDDTLPGVRSVTAPPSATVKHKGLEERAL